MDIQKTEVICEYDPQMGGFNFYFVGQLKVVYLDDEENDVLLISSNPNSLEKMTIDVVDVKKNILCEGQSKVGMNPYNLGKLEQAIEYFKRQKVFEDDEEFMPSYYTLLEFVKKVVENGN